MKTSNTNNQLLEEFNNMSLIPMFEIEIDDEYYVYYINATDEGLELGGASNTGFMSYGLELVEWDDCFSLDEHLHTLYEVAYNDAMNKATEI